jgi:hypothetical protein
VVSRLAAQGSIALRLRGRQHGTMVAIEKRLTIPERAARPWVKKLWAQERVGFLLEEMRAHGATSEREDETIELALRHNLLTPYTAFLAIPESELTARGARMLSSVREEKRRILAGARYQGSASTGLEELCRIDPDTCASIDLEQAARRDVNGEIYAVQQSGYPGGGCASCTIASRRPFSFPAATWLLLVVALWIRRR